MRVAKSSEIMKSTVVSIKLPLVILINPYYLYMGNFPLSVQITKIAMFLSFGNQTWPAGNFHMFPHCPSCKSTFGNPSHGHGGYMPPETVWCLKAPIVDA